MLSHNTSDTKGKDGIVTPATQIVSTGDFVSHMSVLEAGIVNSESDSEGKSR